MKMTFDLSAELVRQLKFKAAVDGRKLKDLIAEGCELLLAKASIKKMARSRKCPFPIIKGGRPAKPGQELTPERVAEILWGNGES